MSLKNHTYEIKSLKGVPLRKLKQDLLKIIESVTSSAETSTLQILSGLDIIILTTTNNKVIDKLLSNRDFKMKNYK